MRRDSLLFEAFERAYQRRRAPDYHWNLEVFEALYREAVVLGVLPPEDPLEGIEADLHRTRVLRVRGPSGKARPQPLNTPG